MFSNAPESIFVAQDEKVCVLYSADDKNKPLLWTKDLNPCMGLILSGEVNLSDSTKIKFALLAHTSGLSKHQEQEILSNPTKKLEIMELHNKEILLDFITAIEGEVEATFASENNLNEELDDEAMIQDILFENFYVIRCIQSTQAKDRKEQIAAQLQNEVANNLKILFANQTWVHEAANECQLSVIEFSKNYKVINFEELEVENSNGDISHMKCYLNSGDNGELKVHYKHQKPKMTNEEIEIKEEIKKIKKDLLFYTAHNRPTAKERKPKRLKIANDVIKPQDKVNKKSK